MFSFNVWLDGKLIDTVFYSVGKHETIKEAVESTRKSLIGHDGYDPGIVVTWPKGQRLTTDEWELLGNYGQGWELLCAGTYKEVKQNKRDYRENEPGTPLKVVCKRVRKG